MIRESKDGEFSSDDDQIGMERSECNSDQESPNETMLRLPPNTVRFYNDSANWEGPADAEGERLDVEAERAFRDAFLEAALEAAKWKRPDPIALAIAWKAR